MKFQFKGLTQDEVVASRKQHGSNELTPYVIESFWSKLVENFKDPIIIILTGALVIIFVLSLFGLTEWYEAVAIGVAVLLATVVSTLSEYSNETSFQKLQEEASQISSNVFRDGHVTHVPIGELVKGDYVLLQSGDKVPADGVLASGELRVNQASLTGESEAVIKRVPHDDEEEKDFDLGNPYHLFRGSVIEDGEGVMQVETVGDKSFYGILSKELAESETRLSPLQLKLKGLAEQISKAGYIAAVLIAVTFIFNKLVVAQGFEMDRIIAHITDWEVVITEVMNALVLSIIIVVAAIPEGLPMMIAIVLSLNMQKLLKEKVLVRKLLGIETAGSLNILFSDKTGTITKGKLEPKMFIDGSGKSFDSYTSIHEPLGTLLGFSILENTSSFIAPDGEVVGGNMSERALISFMALDDIKKINKWEVDQKNKILFNSQRKFSAAEVELNGEIKGIKEKKFTLIKGAPEVILSGTKNYYKEDGTIAPIPDIDRLVKDMDVLADQGIRLIALSTSDEPIRDDEALPKHSTLVGIVGIRDEIRDESLTSIAAVQKAGVQAVMITGDRKGTAKAIAQEVGLLQNKDDVILVSSELNEMSDDDIKKILPNLRVIARALPTDKSRMVRISKSVGKVVGMTGDGVNDSAALKQSDVGIAMGSGSEVSKEAGDIVILDDNFNSINNAIRYGRTIFKSIRKFVVFQLTVNVAAVTTAFLGPIFGIDFPLTIIQLLWINIIMDTLAAIAFGGEPALMRYMEEKPVDRDENIVTKEMFKGIMSSGLFITFFSLLFLTYSPFKEMFMRDGVHNEAVFLTAFFNLFIFMIVFNGFNVRTESINIFDNLGQNPGFLRVMGLIFTLQIVFTYIGGTILRTVGLSPREWLMIIGMSLIIIPVDMIRKAVFK